jgi:hypothetical protein
MRFSALKGDVHQKHISCFLGTSRQEKGSARAPVHHHSRHHFSSSASSASASLSPAAFSSVASSPRALPLAGTVA